VNGAVGNSWTNIGTATTAIENNALKIVSPNGTGIKHDFTPVSSGVVYIQYDWMVVSTGWYADAFPTGLITHLTTDGDGNLSYDLDGTMISPTILQNIGLGMYATIRLKIDLDADLFSVWINDVLAAENIDGNAISSFSSFTFRGLGASTVQYVDNFMLFNGAAPSGFTVSGNLNDIALSWNAASYPEALSYRIYRDTASPASILLMELPGTASNYTDSSAQPNTDYYYRITAVQAGAVETDFSPELMAHLQPQIAVIPQNITFNVGYGYEQTQSISIQNSGNYGLNYSISGADDNKGSLSFNGVNTPSSYVDLGNFGQQHTYTISMWIKPNQQVNDWAMLIDCNHSGTYNWCWQRYQDTSNWNQWGFMFPYLENVWQHVAVVVTEGTVTPYVNGVSQGSYYFGSINYARTPLLRLGQWALGGRAFNGLIDDLHISTVARYSGDFDPNVEIVPDSDTYGYWKFDEESGSICYDESQYARNATIVNNVQRSLESPKTSPISVNINSGSIPSSDQAELQITYDATRMECGSYIDTLYINTNDSVNPIIPIIITTNVLPPNPVLTPVPLILNLNVTNPIRETQIQLSNVGQGKLDYSLSGTDDFGDPSLMPELGGLTAMGIYNGHWYYRSINDLCHWSEAKTKCENYGGHLATISDGNENDFIFNNITIESWIGLHKTDINGSWEWVTEEPLSYTNWGPGEPNYSGVENTAVMWKGLYPGMWNDDDMGLFNYVVEFDNPLSFLSFDSITGTIETNSFMPVSMTASGSHLSDGVYTTSIEISAEGGAGPWFFPVTVNVDYTPPLTVSGLAVDPASTNDDQIGITWFANAVADSVVSYKIYRRGADETVWQLKATVPATQLAYVDSDFGDFVDTYQYYRVRAVDWVGNISAEGDSVMGALNRFLSPENMVIQNINNRDIHLSWDPVTETISGLPGTPTCYVIYKSQYPSPITDFDFLTISFTNEFIHQWALHFQPLNRLFYVVTAYGGDMGRMQSLVAQKREWKYGELEQVLQESGFQQLDVIK
jgi:hypothetical protein